MKFIHRRAEGVLAALLIAFASAALPGCRAPNTKGKSLPASEQRAPAEFVWTTRVPYSERLQSLIEAGEFAKPDAWLALEQDAILTILTSEGGSTELDPTGEFNPLALTDSDSLPIWFTRDGRAFVARASRERFPAYFRLLDDVRVERKYTGHALEVIRDHCTRAQQILEQVAQPVEFASAGSARWVPGTSGADSRIRSAVRKVEAKLRFQGKPGYACSWILTESKPRNLSTEIEEERPLGLTLLYSFQVADEATAPFSMKVPGPFGPIVNGGPQGPTRHGYSSASFCLHGALPDGTLELGVQGDPEPMVRGLVRIVH